MELERGVPYVLRDGELVPKHLAAPLRAASHLAAPQIWSDLPAYRSVLEDPRDGPVMIEGRAARREEMARHGVREVDPSEGRELMRAREERHAAKREKKDG